MKRNILTLTILSALMVIIAACTAQPATEKSLVGSEAPDFNLENALGGQVSLSDYQGTPVLLFFHMAVG